jgi:hypothetical protein
MSENYLEGLDGPTAEVVKTGKVVDRFISKELKAQRYPICKSCEYFTPSMCYCSVCGCWCALKTLFANESCPKGKW